MKYAVGDTVHIKAVVASIRNPAYVELNIDRSWVGTFPSNVVVHVEPRSLKVGDDVGMIKGCLDRPKGKVICLYERWALVDFGFTPPIVVLTNELERIKLMVA